MSSIYLHKLTVTVITTESSPDVIERLLDKACEDCGMRGDARTDSDNRQRGPAIAIADPPVFSITSKTDEHRWAAEQDIWLDSWPTVESFENVKG